MSLTQPGEVVQGWTIDHCIGRGAFAEVWKAYKTGSVHVVAAIKVITTENIRAKLKQSLEFEVSILKRISHSNVVTLYEVIETQNRMFIVMEYCGGGDLAAYLRDRRRVDETVARGFLQQLAAGLKELWHHHFVHRDLKPQNLLLSDSSASPTVKIADFGFARDLQPQRLAATVCGSPLYMAPEICQSHKYDAKADLWSVGIILYELVVGKAPWEGSNHVQLLRHIQRSPHQIPEAIACHLSEHCTALISQLLRINPIERISFEEFFAHPFLHNGEPPSESDLRPDCSTAPRQTPTNHLPTIASGIALPLVAGEEKLSSAVEREEEPSLEAGENRLRRLVSMPVTRQILKVVDNYQYFSGRRAPATPLSTVRPGAHVQNSLEDEDDYVIIERSSSSHAVSGLRAYSQSAPATGRAPLHSLPPPQPVSVPLLAAQPPAPTHPPMYLSKPTNEAGRMRFTAGLPRPEALKRVAVLLEDLAIAKHEQHDFPAALAFRLLALQVLSNALETLQTSGLGSDGQPISGTAASLELSEAVDVSTYMHLIADRAQQVGIALGSDERDKTPMPDVWELVYLAALAFAKAGAVEELLSNYMASLRYYAKAGELFYFLFVDGSDLPLQPQLQLSEGDERRLQRYTACVALRHQECIALLSTSDEAQDFGGVTSVKFEGYAGDTLSAHHLAASLSLHPPLKSRILSEAHG